MPCKLVELHVVSHGPKSRHFKLCMTGSVGVGDDMNLYGANIQSTRVLQYFAKSVA